MDMYSYISYLTLSLFSSYSHMTMFQDVPLIFQEEVNITDPNKYLSNQIILGPIDPNAYLLGFFFPYIFYMELVLIFFNMM